jgi:hypothetical protein
MQHKDHGLHYAVSPQDQEEMEKIGWIAISEHPAIEKERKMKLALTQKGDIIETQEAPKAKLGRPSKLSNLGGSNGNSSNSNKS